MYCSTPSFRRSSDVTMLDSNAPAEVWISACGSAICPLLRVLGFCESRKGQVQVEDVPDCRGGHLIGLFHGVRASPGVGLDVIPEFVKFLPDNGVPLVW